MKKYAQSETRISHYVENLFHPEDVVLKQVKKNCGKEGLPSIQLGPMDALHLTVLASCHQGGRAVEIGTLGGYSGISILRGLGQSGFLYTCEIDPHHADVAVKNFKRASLGSQVKVIIGEARKTLDSLNDEALFDLVFIDADKESYPSYYYWAQEHLKKGGFLIADNCFGFGKIADTQVSAEVRALQKFNRLVAKDKSFYSTILPTGEGLFFAVKL